MLEYVPRNKLRTSFEYFPCQFLLPCTLVDFQGFENVCEDLVVDLPSPLIFNVIPRIPAAILETNSNSGSRHNCK